MLCDFGNVHFVCAIFVQTCRTRLKRFVCLLKQQSMALSFKLAKNYLLKQTKIKSNNNNLTREKNLENEFKETGIEMEHRRKKERKKEN